MAITNRKFGVEIECVGISALAASRAIRAVGIDCNEEGYSHRTSSHWKIVTDGSVYDGNNPGIEVVSPPLKGEDGIAEIEKVARALSHAGATINRTCGLHIHVSAEGLTKQDLGNIIRRYSGFETVIDGFMPHSRRNDNNTFCRSTSRLSGYVTAAIHASSISSFIEQITHNDRYFKVNLLAYLRHGTVEFRQHSGSVNGDKIGNWIRFCVNFVEQSKVVGETATARSSVAGRRRGRGPSNKKARLIEALRNAGYAGRHLYQLAGASDYSESTIPVVISNLRREGYVIKKSRVYGTYRLVSEPNASQPSAETIRVPQIAVNDMNDTCFRGLDPEVVSYYQERAEDLRAA